jgi:DNA (cytosine-5)-methyltransferase 1
VSARARIKALDLFAGTGWGVACQRLGIKEAGVEIMPEAVATRTANGMDTIYNDVWDGLQLTAERHRDQYGSYGLLIASPPCQTFSLAGKGAGRAALDEVLEAIELHAYKDAAALLSFGERHDMRTALVLTPLAYVWRDRPRLVAMEQVPTVLPVWEACAEVMREWGYEVKVEVLNAEQYGVPQTRKRAILVARRGGPVSMPTPTHSRYYSRTPDKLDPGVLKWVSMAEALGWGAKDQPSHTITAGVHGPTDRWASGGNSVRKALDAKIGGPEWIDKPNQDTDSRTTYAQRFDVADVAALQSYPTAVKNMGKGMVERYGDRPGRAGDQPSFAIRASAGGTEPGGFVLQDEDGRTRKLDVLEAAALQSYPTHLAASGTSCQVVDPRPVTAPAPTITGAGDAEWGTRPTRAAGPGDRDPNGRAVTLKEAATLQTFERPFVWRGTKTKQFLQIGNAVPPLLAEHILAALIGVPTSEVAA